MTGSFGVDLDRLDRVVGELARCEQTLEALGADLERQMRELHDQWTGLAAAAQAAAHAEWSDGLRRMHQALGTLRTVAAGAHDNYAAAAATNLAMWRSVT